MDYSAKYRISLVATALCLVAALIGLKNIYETQSADGVWGVGLLFGGVILGCAAGITMYYYKPRKDEVKDQQQIAVETLNQLAAQRKHKK